MKILLTGSDDQLGYDFRQLFDRLGIKYIATDYKELDITDSRALEKYFVENNDFTHIINCAAYNDVDKAETDERVFLLNEETPLKLSECARKIDAVFITYSTDFVFDGKKGENYIEKDTPTPISKYGLSKANGERKVLSNYEKSFVIRTSWVFGIANSNFNTQVINWSKTGYELNIVDDQISAPTYSKDLAEFSWKLIQTGKFGLYHISNSGTASKFDQAKYVLDKIGWKGRLERAKTKDFNLTAARPEYSKLDSTKIEKLLGEKIPSWQSGIDRFLEEMRKNREI